MEEEKEPLLSIRPRFNVLLFFFSKHFLTLVAIIFLACIVSQYTPEEYKDLPMICVIAIVIYVLYFIIRGFWEKRQYNRMQYLFYEDRLIIIDRRKRGKDSEIFYNQIFDVIMIQNYIEKFINQGELVVKLSNSRFMAKHVDLVGIGNFSKTTQDIASIIYGNQNEE